MGIGVTRKRLAARLLGAIRVLNAAAKHSLFLQFLDVDNLGGKKRARRAGRVRSGDLDVCGLIVAPASFEAETSAGDVFADNNVVLGIGIADTRGEVRPYAYVLAPVVERRGRGAHIGSKSVGGQDKDGLC